MEQVKEKIKHAWRWLADHTALAVMLLLGLVVFPLWFLREYLLGRKEPKQDRLDPTGEQIENILDAERQAIRREQVIGQEAKRQMEEADSEAAQQKASIERDALTREQHLERLAKEGTSEELLRELEKELERKP